MAKLSPERRRWLATDQQTNDRPNTMTDELTTGLAYDLANQSLVNITNTDAGRVGEQKPAMQDLIKRADGNKFTGFDDETRCVEVTYVEWGQDDNPKEYTMPATRITQDSGLIEHIVAVARDAGMADVLFGGESKNHTLEDY